MDFTNYDTPSGFGFLHLIFYNHFIPTGLVVGQCGQILFTGKNYYGSTICGG
jgi:hypothetical protein